MNNSQYKNNPCSNRLLKIKLKLKDINMKKLDIDDGSYYYDINSFISACLNQKNIKSPRNETSNRLTKVSNPLSSRFNRQIEGHQGNKGEQHQLKQKGEFVVHEFHKPKQLFSVNLNQFNIANKIKQNKHYQPVGSFELKLSKELQRISNSYKKDDIRTLWYKNETLDAVFRLKPRYEMYRDVKCIENRFSGKKFKFKLLPINYKAKDNMNKLAKRFYNHSCHLLQTKQILYLNN